MAIRMIDRDQTPIALLDHPGVCFTLQPQGLIRGIRRRAEQQLVQQTVGPLERLLTRQANLQELLDWLGRAGSENSRSRRGLVVELSMM